MKATAETIAKRFVTYLKEEEVYGLLPEVTKLLQEEVWRNQDITVISAAPLSEADKKAVTKQVTDTWGEHPVVYTVDSHLLSGMIIRFQDNIIDLSGRHNLKNLKETLSKPSHE